MGNTRHQASCTWLPLTKLLSLACGHEEQYNAASSLQVA
jgi:hypothetical protein